MGIDIPRIWIPELVLTMKKDGNILCGIYLKAAFTLLAVDIAGGVYSRAAFNPIFLYKC